MFIRKVRGFYKAAIKKSLPNVKLSSDTWRRRWDSNPRDIAVKLISSFLVYIATDGIYRKKAEVVGR